MQYYTMAEALDVVEAHQHIETARQEYELPILGIYPHHIAEDKHFVTVRKGNGQLVVLSDYMKENGLEFDFSKWHTHRND